MAVVGLHVPNIPYGLCGRKATFEGHDRAQELCEGRVGRPGLHVPTSPYGLCGRKATFEGHYKAQELCEGPQQSLWSLWT